LTSTIWHILVQIVTMFLPISSHKKIGFTLNNVWYFVNQSILEVKWQLVLKSRNHVSWIWVSLISCTKNKWIFLCCLLCGVSIGLFKIFEYKFLKSPFSFILNFSFALCSNLSFVTIITFNHCLFFSKLDAYVGGPFFSFKNKLNPNILLFIKKVEVSFFFRC
jgi:hypothetical protein